MTSLVLSKVRTITWIWAKVTLLSLLSSISYAESRLSSNNEKVYIWYL